LFSWAKHPQKEESWCGRSSNGGNRVPIKSFVAAKVNEGKLARYMGSGSVHNSRSVQVPVPCRFSIWLCSYEDG
jgi:hypothetical protein